MRWMIKATATARVSEDVSIEPASIRDLLPLRTLERDCFPKDSWPLLDLLGVLTIPNVLRLKAVRGGAMVGFIAGDVRRTEGTAWITTFCVAPKHQGHGIGKALLEACEEQLTMPVIRLSVRSSNHIAIRLYLNRGYVKVGEWPRYYNDGEGAIVMEKKRI
jgi:ribosomal protein S18 acetylase RimI-like enzyme